AELPSAAMPEAERPADIGRERDRVAEEHEAEEALRLARGELHRDEAAEREPAENDTLVLRERVVELGLHRVGPVREGCILQAIGRLAMAGQERRSHRESARGDGVDDGPDL